MDYKEALEVLEDYPRSINAHDEAVQVAICAIRKQMAIEQLDDENIDIIKTLQDIINRSDSPIGNGLGCIIPKSAVNSILNMLQSQQMQIKAQNENLDKHVWDFCSIGGCEGALPDCWKTCPNSEYNKTKREAYKEIVEKLKTKKQSSTTIFGEDYDYVDVDDIDKILEEMTADDYAENNKTQS